MPVEQKSSRLAPARDGVWEGAMAHVAGVSTRDGLAAKGVTAQARRLAGLRSLTSSGAHHIPSALHDMNLEQSESPRVFKVS